MSDQDWDPAKYEQYDRDRARPAWDLMDRIPAHPMKNIVDLGCGAGAQAAALKRRWPEASVTGVDSSLAMLDRARTDNPDQVLWLHGNVARFMPEHPLDLVYSNAALQWLDDHASLFPRIAGFLSTGGVLAVQMPHNYDAPSHQVMRTIAEQAGWSADLSDVRRSDPVAPPDVYYDILRPHVSELDIWETTYLHVLEGDDPVAHWTKSTGLRPFLNALADDAEREAFFERYATALQAHYPKQADGKTLFPFQRLFMVATR